VRETPARTCREGLPCAGPRTLFAEYWRLGGCFELPLPGLLPGPLPGDALPL